MKYPVTLSTCRARPTPLRVPQLAVHYLDQLGLLSPSPGFTSPPTEPDVTLGSIYHTPVRRYAFQATHPSPKNDLNVVFLNKQACSLTLSFLMVVLASQISKTQESYSISLGVPSSKGANCHSPVFASKCMQM